MITKKISIEFKKRFAEEIKRSSIDGKEHYIPLCLDERKKLDIDARTCIGTECSVPSELTIDCPGGTTIQGDFHTHPYMKKIRELPKMQEVLMKRYGYIPSDETILQHVKDINEIRKSNSIPSHGDIINALRMKCKANINYTICIGSDLSPERINCFEIDRDISKEDCDKIDKEFEKIKSTDIGSQSPEEWAQEYFNPEKIDIEKYYKKVKIDTGIPLMSKKDLIYRKK